MSNSHPKTSLKVKFFRNAQEIYGPKGLEPSTAEAVGVDLRACLRKDETITIEAGERVMIAAGIAIEHKEKGLAAFVYSRSGLGGLKGLVVAQGVGIIDPDYRGEISVPILNTSKEKREIQCGERIAQIVFQSFKQPEFIISQELSDTDRGEGGFGHTGTK